MDALRTLVQPAKCRKRLRGVSHLTGERVFV
jgi:hypothetical protein